MALPSSPPPGPSPGEPPTVATSERAFWILGAVVALVTLAVGLPSVRNGWVNWDDADNFLGNPHFAAGAPGEAVACAPRGRP